MPTTRSKPARYGSKSSIHTHTHIYVNEQREHWHHVHWRFPSQQSVTTFFLLGGPLETIDKSNLFAQSHCSLKRLRSSVSPPCYPKICSWIAIIRREQGQRADSRAAHDGPLPASSGCGTLPSKAPGHRRDLNFA
jgi:hypothetical protein